MNMIHREKISMNVRVCDIAARLRPSGLLWMFQDASEVLTERFGVGPRTMEQRGLNWIVARTACECERMPLCEETVEMTVWAGREKLGIYPWQYRIRDEAGKTLIRGCSLWVLSDSETRTMLSPKVPRLELAEKNPPEAEYPWPKAMRLPPEMENRTVRRVGYRECDLNGHMNNACYLDWICDLPPLEFHKSHEMKKLLIDYRTESVPEEDVALDWTLTDDALLVRGEGKFLCRMDF